MSRLNDYLEAAKSSPQGKIRLSAEKMHDALTLADGHLPMDGDYSDKEMIRIDIAVEALQKAKAQFLFDNKERITENNKKQLLKEFSKYSNFYVIENDGEYESCFGTLSPIDSIFDFKACDITKLTKEEFIAKMNEPKEMDHLFNK